MNFPPCGMLGAMKKHRQFRGCSAARARAGFTVVEVSIGLLIMTIGFLTVVGVLLQSTHFMQITRDETRANQILQSEMESMRKLNWAEIENLGTTSTFQLESRFAAAFGNRYQCARTITTTKTGQKRVVLQCRWTDSRNVEHVREYVTLFTQEGMNDYYYRSL